jgi:[protein-PII] uridylyltransferase
VTTQLGPAGGVDDTTSPAGAVVTAHGLATGHGVGAAARRARAADLEDWLRRLFDTAAGPVGAGTVGAGSVALVALGGLARHECAPYGDADLLLLYEGPDEPAELAQRLWYPLWDAGIAVDHSVRTVAGAGEVAAADLKAALGLLDARHVAGDGSLTARLRERARDGWRRRAPAHLSALREVTLARWRTHGELAFLLDGDLKEARGGLRDVRVLRGIAYAQVADAWRPPVRAAYTRLLDARDGLHLVAGRRRDRLFAQDLAEVAALVELPGGDELRRRVADDARTIAYAVDDALRAASRWLTRERAGTRRPGPAPRAPIAPDVVAHDGELVLARAAITPAVDPTLSLRVAAAAARHGLRISPGTLEWLGRHCPPPPRPWSEAARAAFIQLLGAGSALVPTWEACDRYGLVAGWLPEWSRVRSAPQHNPVHRYTVDRHLIEAVAAASRHARDVARPDLLVVGALLHDIGKGLPGDHSVAGVAVAAGLAAAIGLPDDDVRIVGELVRWHLLLPEVATRRDLSDPLTVSYVAGKVGDIQMLELLHALSRADATATGPGAWSAWKERLVADLVGRVRAVLTTGQVPPAPAALTDHRLFSAPTLPAVEIAPDRVVVAAPDRIGLLATIAGCLTLHRLDVVSADTATQPTGSGPVAVVACRVQPRDAGGPDPQRLATDVRRALAGELRVDAALAARVRGGHRSGPRRAAEVPPRVVWALDPATDATILELRAADDVGLLFRVAHAMELAGANVRAARISTLGSDVVDAFYLVGDWSSPDVRSAVERAVVTAAGHGGP